ncbi:MAG: PQQ-binding-like beta-propeller repeat protein [Planctomycetota bacterium]
MRSSTPAAALLLSWIGTACAASQDVRGDAWPQWGGPSRDFSIGSAELADRWPEDGPPRLWQRPLGDGYASIVSDGELLFTMYRPRLDDPGDQEEVVIAMQATTGATVWESRYPSAMTRPPHGGVSGPNSTPVLVGNRVYAIGTHTVVRCLDKTTGTLLWSRDLQADFASPPVVANGYSISPIVYGDTLIVPLGTRPAEGEVADRSRSVLALDLGDGHLVWSSDAYVVWHSSPLVIDHGGTDQVVLMMNDGIAAIDPSSGRELWRLDFDRSELKHMTPLWNGVDLLVFAPDGGSRGARAIRLVLEDGKTVPELAWINRAMKCPIHIGVHDGDRAYVPGRSGMYGYDLATGERLWKQPGIDMASCILAGDKLLALGVEGELTLATPSREGLAIHAQGQVAERNAISCPTLVGHTLYVRDEKNIMAFDLGVRDATSG